MHINSIYTFNGKDMIKYIPFMILIIYDIQENNNNFDTVTKYFFDAVILKYWQSWY